jgi:hypothetical protein
MSARKAQEACDDQEACDQVVRLQEFSEAHPEVSIEHKSGPSWHWMATWADARGKLRAITVSDYVHAHPLKTLLDKLGREFGE